MTTSERVLSRLCAYCGHQRTDHDARWNCHNAEPCLCKMGHPDEPPKASMGRAFGCSAVALIPTSLVAAAIWFTDWRLALIGVVVALVVAAILGVIEGLDS